MALDPHFHSCFRSACSQIDETVYTQEDGDDERDTRTVVKLESDGGRGEEYIEVWIVWEEEIRRGGVWAMGLG